VYPSGRDILDYLRRYAEAFGLMSRIRFGARGSLHLERRGCGDD
jgi:dimethylaniline monooxygenase (N-oxide forming)